MTKREKMYKDIKTHGERLNIIFDTGLDPVTLCKKLRRLEVKAHKLAEDYCNGENGVNSDNWDNKCQLILTKVFKVLKINVDKSFFRDKECAIFLNGDARGYALKIQSEYVSVNKLNIYRDFGGYGILAPDFSN